MPRRHLKDIQSEEDHRNIPINRVGVKDIRYPITVLDKTDGEQHTVANVNMYVELPHNFRGTHMSRFLEILNHYRKGISVKNIHELLEDMKKRLDAETAYFEVEFPYFITREAPVSKEKAKMEYVCKLLGNSDMDYYHLEIKVPVTSLCPCSKEISNYGAHNQRSLITIEVKSTPRIWFEDLIEIAENSCSCEIYPMLKREDEKYVTEKAYENPMFVEDMVRSLAEKLLNTNGILWFSIESENFESIHNHSAYAKIEQNISL